MTTTEETPAHQQARHALESLGLTIRTTFVPWSKTPAAEAVRVKARKEQRDPDTVLARTFKERTLNWSVTVLHRGRDVVTVEYSAGIGHCPCYKSATFHGNITTDGAEAIRIETERGKMWIRFGRLGEPITPDPVDVLYCLRSDADAIDFSTYEDWAANFDYDSDSRKGEVTYRECLRIALALRAAIGDEGLRALTTAYEGY